MSSLSREFLTTIAREYQLSQEQEEAFVELYSGDGNEVKVAESLHVSSNALRSRMTGVYRKFSISGKGPGKFRQLQVLLLKKQQAASATAPVVSASGDIEALVQDIRQKVHDDIKERCSTMRVLDMTQPIELGDIYTHVNILEKILGRRRKEITELLQDSDLENFDRFTLGKIQQGRLSGLDAVARHSKLMILGKPGAGKTTLLKRLATLCNLHEFQPHRVPVFVTLKDFAEANDRPNLLAYITQQWSACDIQGPEIVALLMNQGHALILLDGLDEVRAKDNDRVLREIETFTNQFRTCQFVMTCRIAAREYTFEQFTEVEVADFNDEQITEFVAKWFKARKDPVKTETFIEKLKDNQPIQELATNPLLLTLLCLVFGEAADFPRNRSELYKEGLDVLLKKWDAKRNIERDQLYKQLSLKRKEDLLSQIALDMFKGGDYFFKQKIVEAKITQYIQNLPDAKTDPAALQLDSEAVLKSIEAQHGLLVERARSIYSFSHLTFQEYFTARRIVDSPAVKALESLQNLASHITDKRWREVFLLTVGMLPDADYLLQLMKTQVDALLTGDDQLQKFITWGREKTISVEFTCKPAAVRAFYLYRARAFAHDRARDYARTFYRVLDHDRVLYRVLDRDLYLYRALDCALALYRARDRARDLYRDLYRARDLYHDLDRVTDSVLQKALHYLKHQLPEYNSDVEVFKHWWKTNGSTWVEELRTVMIEYLNIGHDWQFSVEQLEKLEKYYDANQLLVDCLHSDCYITRLVRENIEDTLLLPISA